VGVKVTVMVQLAPAATLEPQLLVWAKAPGASAMLMMFKETFPVFVRVTDWGALGTFRNWPPKTRLDSDN